MSIPEAFADLGLQMYNTFANLQKKFRLCRKFLASSPKSFFCGLAFFDRPVAPGGEKTKI